MAYPSNKIVGAKLISWQNDLVREFLKLKKDERLVIKKCRQVGCSFAFAQILFYVAINRPRSTSIYITTTNAAARKFFQDMSEFCKESSLVSLNLSLLEMSFWNGSIIYFKSSESQLRGISCKKGGIMVVDECAFLKSDIWTSILPFTTVSKANTLIASTPWTKRGMYYTFYERALSGDPGYHLIDTKLYDLSYFISEDQREEYRKILSPQAFRTEIDGEFMDSTSGVFGDYQSLYVEPEDKDPVWCGIDFPMHPNMKINLPGYELEVMKDVTKISVAQYVDFQGFIKLPLREGMDKILSIFIIPKGHKYNDGYDIIDLQGVIRNNMSFRVAEGLLGFFLRKYSKSLIHFLGYCRRQIRKTRDPEMMKRLENLEKETKEKLDSLIHLIG